LDRAIDEEILYASGLVCSLDALRAGTTSVIDHHASPSFITGSLETIKRAYEKTGLRGTTCYEVTDRNGTRGMKQGVDENVAFAKRIDREKAEGRWSGLMEAHIGGHAPNTLSEESLELLAGAVRDTGRGLHLHVAEDRYDVSHSHAVYGRDIMARLDDHGLLNEKTILVHGLYLSAEEIGLLNERDGFLVHNPRSNMNNGVGYDHRLPLVKNLALGTDGIGGDMFEEIKHAYFKHKDAGGVWWPGDFLKILAAGNRILERNFGTSFGRIEAGYTADLVIASYDSPTPIVPENIAGHLVFGMNGSTVETVMVNGSVVMENRQFPLDVATIYSDARAQAGRLWARMESIAP
jgi:putative selenium metabolism protein SsnA